MVSVNSRNASVLVYSFVTGEKNSPSEESHSSVVKARRGLTPVQYRT